MTNEQEQRFAGILEAVINFQIRQQEQLNAISKLLFRMCGEESAPAAPAPVRARSFNEILKEKFDIAECERIYGLNGGENE